MKEITDVTKPNKLHQSFIAGPKREIPELQHSEGGISNPASSDRNLDSDNELSVHTSCTSGNNFRIGHR